MCTYFIHTMESTKVVKKLQSGVVGTTYLIEKNNKQYVCKIEKIFEDDIECDTSKSLWREIEFRNFTSHYPDHFMQLKSWSILNDCNHAQPTLPMWIPKKIRKLLIEKQKSPYCSQLVYTPVLDGTMNDFYKKNKYDTINKTFCSMLCQFIYFFYLLGNSGYLHTDIHGGNIM